MTNLAEYSSKSDLISALVVIGTIPQAYHDQSPEFIIAEIERTVKVALADGFAGNGGLTQLGPTFKLPIDE